MQKIRAVQGGVLSELQRRKVPVTWAGQTLVNAIFVRATHDTAIALRGIPGVAHVQYLPPVKRDLNTALNLINVPAVGRRRRTVECGCGNQDRDHRTGIDQNHPGSSGFHPECAVGFSEGRFHLHQKQSDRGAQLTSPSRAGIDPNNPVPTSEPDDTSPRDRVGVMAPPLR